MRVLVAAGFCGHGMHTCITCTTCITCITCIQVRPRVFVAAGFCGHGMPQCYGAAKAVAQMIQGGAEVAKVHPHVRKAANVARVRSPRPPVPQPVRAQDDANV